VATKGQHETEGERKYSGGGELQGTHYTHIWNYHNEIISYYQCIITQK
jgi:hypothetical protein